MRKVPFYFIRFASDKYIQSFVLFNQVFISDLKWWCKNQMYLSIYLHREWGGELTFQLLLLKIFRLLTFIVIIDVFGQYILQAFHIGQKHCDYKNKDEVNSLNFLNNYKASSQKFRQMNFQCYIAFLSFIY